jgi:DNA-binding transcriptional LysR family regulator
VRALARPDSGPVALAVVGTLAGGPPVEILKRFAAEYPGVELTLRTATSAEVSDLIRRGEATIGLRYDRDRLARSRLRIACTPNGFRSSARPIIRAPAGGSRNWPICAASAGSRFR